VPNVTVRYIVDDVDAAIAFYADRLGFEEVMHPAPTFAMLVRGELRLVLSRPSSAPGGGQVVGDRVPRPGGWNRFALEVEDVDAAFAELRRHDVAFRGPIVDGVGGRQVIAEDPSGNPVELFQPTIPEARLDAG
jgi:catechol 2,3-dioxygenase-like lactoylglutathione lyase family enzyme